MSSSTSSEVRREFLAGNAPHLTIRELDLLEYLLRYAGSVVSRDMLVRDAWKETGRVTPIDNVVDVTIARLRNKVDEPFASPLIQTVRGVGFRFGGGEA